MNSTHAHLPSHVSLHTRLPPHTHSPFTHVYLHTHSVGDAKTSGIRVGDKLLEVNGVSVRGLEHREAGKMMSEGPRVATLLIHTIKPAPTPNGESVQDILM